MKTEEEMRAILDNQYLNYSHICFLLMNKTTRFTIRNVVIKKCVF